MWSESLPQGNSAADTQSGLFHQRTGFCEHVEVFVFQTFRQTAAFVALQFESRHAGAAEGVVGRRAQLVTSCRTFSRTLNDF